MAKIVTLVGWVLLLAGVGLLIVGYSGVAMSDGVWAALQMANPFNIANFVVTVISLAPGILLITWGRKLSDKN